MKAIQWAIEGLSFELCPLCPQKIAFLMASHEIFGSAPLHIRPKDMQDMQEDMSVLLLLGLY